MTIGWWQLVGDNWLMTIGWWQAGGEEEGGGGAVTTLKTKNPHVNAGK